jgi:hypothetical protein
MTTTYDIVAGAERRLSTEDNWCQSSLAEDADGVPTSPHSSNAARWCTLGALRREQNRHRVRYSSCTEQGSIDYIEPSVSTDVENVDQVRLSVRSSKANLVSEGWLSSL